jgi:hypothetical protein
MSNRIIPSNREKVKSGQSELDGRQFGLKPDLRFQGLVTWVWPVLIKTQPRPNRAKVKRDQIVLCLFRVRGTRSPCSKRLGGSLLLGISGQNFG